MPPKRIPLWAHFYQGKKQNSAQFKAYCVGCLKTHRPAAGSTNNTMDVDAGERPGDELSFLEQQAWFANVRALTDTQHIRSEKSAMIAHLTSCPHASAAAKQLKGEKSRDDADDDDTPSGKRKQVEFVAMEKVMQQMELKVFRGLNIPFNDAQAEIISFLMFRSTPTDLMPLDKVISGRLLDEATARVEKEIVSTVKGKYATASRVQFSHLAHGWKDKYSITGVDISVGGKSYLIDVIHTRGKRKDGESMCEAFSGHIDKAEHETGCIIVCYLCDNDGGSQSGQNKQAMQITEDTADVISWINNHERVRDIFEEVQGEQNGGSLKAPLCQAAIICRDNIIAVQVSAKKNKKKRKKLTDEASKFCELLDNPIYWKNLQTIADDIEPICYITNINQGDKNCGNQVLLGFAGVYLHFKRHTIPVVAAGMAKHIEKRWAAMDQHFFILCMVLNPSERVSQFADHTGASIFTLSAILLELYQCVKSRLPPRPLTPEQQAELDNEKEIKEAEVGQAFLKYMSTTGVFTNFNCHHKGFEKMHENDPVRVWEVMLNHADIRELADFAILILGISMNQGGNEHDFSDWKIKRTRLHNRLSFEKTGKMSKVGTSIRAENVATSLVKPWQEHKNHNESRVANLIAVPQYADLLENEENSNNKAGEHRVSSRLVNSGAAWRKLYNTWAVAVRVEELEAEELECMTGELDDTTNNPGSRPSNPACTVLQPPAPERRTRWLPCPPSQLFGSKIPQPPERVPCKAFSWEKLLMQLLAAEPSDEEPDDGELEGSGDDYEED
ncbi:hypothetical protein B0H13DRAFT_2241397 [Mycena leptocephala]|nr:hypothetical protein B0H13DRAFT_2241397 [Mycena leptocephala]